MTDEAEVAQEATEEVVQTEVEQTEAAEAPESTEGQVESQPAEDDKESEEISPSKARRERRKAEQARIRAEAEQAKKQRDEAQARLAKIEAAAKSAQPPKENDFDDYNQYLIALGAYQASQQIDHRSMQEIEETATQAQQKIEYFEQQRAREAAQIWAEQKAEAASRYADFDAVVHPNLPIAQHTADLIYESDVGADVAYYLGTNPDLAARIAQMNPVQAAREFGKIEASLTPPKVRTKSNAPPPINPVRGAATGVLDVTKMTNEEYRQARMAGKI